mmetsp:Transcript_71706/g.226553  ORF Transcript_71706/g.226553 Transcript_71706/m.226553 type:complete len:225 (-) Transcript_71706:409-1083(-)
MPYLNDESAGTRCLSFGPRGVGLSVPPLDPAYCFLVDLGQSLNPLAISSSTSLTWKGDLFSLLRGSASLILKSPTPNQSDRQLPMRSPKHMRAHLDGRGAAGAVLGGLLRTDLFAEGREVPGDESRLLGVDGRDLVVAGGVVVHPEHRPRPVCYCDVHDLEPTVPHEVPGGDRRGLRWVGHTPLDVLHHGATDLAGHEVDVGHEGLDGRLAHPEIRWPRWSACP